MTADGVALASWWWRALAVIIDYAIISATVTVVTFPIWRSLYAAIASYFDAVVNAQRSGSAPPTLSPADLIPASSQLILTAATVGVAMLYQSLLYTSDAADD
jgi:hypothetical protein